MPTDYKQAAEEFCNSPLWHEAMWIATTFRGHPTSDAPPVMGLVFADWRKGGDLFRVWTDLAGNADEYDDLRVAIIEGDIPELAPGYSIRISSAQSDWSQSRTNSEPSGQIQRMHPLEGVPAMLENFKREYLRHREFLLAPVVLGDDDRICFNVGAGIIKRELVLRDISAILDDEPDAAVKQVPRIA